MKRFATAATIRATPDRIWPLLVNGPDYPRWNSTVTRVDGTIDQGQTIKVFVKINPGRAFPVKVSELDPGRRMIWSGGMPFGLFKGERVFTLTPNGDGTTQFSMVEEFSGLLAPLIAKSIPDLQPAFDEFALALQREAER
jgi:hypothetical protein